MDQRIQIATGVAWMLVVVAQWTIIAKQGELLRQPWKEKTVETRGLVNLRHPNSPKSSSNRRWGFGIIHRRRTIVIISIIIVQV